MPFIPQIWPEVSRSPKDILSLFGPESKETQERLQKALRRINQPILGLDFEYDPETSKPSILGVSDGFLTISCSYKDGIEYFKEVVKKHPNIVLVGHSIIGADIPILEAEGIFIPLENLEDTIIWFWLTNMHLCKASNKSSLEDGDAGAKGQGYMNLGTMLTSMTNLSNYKDCRGDVCHGPCPKHDVFGYNGLDAKGPLDAVPNLSRLGQIRGVSKLYPMHRKLADVTRKMTDAGVFIDVPYVEKLRKEFEEDKEKLAATFPFNPRSGPAVQDYFRSKGISLNNNQEETIRDVFEETGDEELGRLLEYKELGNGPDRWFAPRVRGKNGWYKGFVDPQGFIHPRLGIYTSSGRLNCVNPNMQNVAARRIDRETGENMGAKIRRAVIPPPGFYLLKADLSNAENRNFLYMAGYDIAPDIDLHSWVAEIAGFTPDMDFVIANKGKPREAAKTVQHAGNYLEGLQLKTVEELRTPKIRKEIESGARIVYPKWTFGNRIVTFTGVNLARRAFGSATLENRHKALGIAERYFGRFEKVRELQQKITKQAEIEKAVKTPLGYYILSYGNPENRMKTAAAIYGSQPVAHITKMALNKLWDAWEEKGLMRPALQVHDEIVCYVRYGVPYQTAAKWLVDAMMPEVPEMPGLIIPAEPAWGKNWVDTEEIEL